MADPIKVDVRYCDLFGEVGIAGHDGPPLPRLAAAANVPDDYFPIGLKISNLCNDEGNTLFHVIAVKKAIYGSTAEKVETKILDTVKIDDAVMFYGSMPTSEFGMCFKEIDITVLRRPIWRAYERISASTMT